MLFKAQAGELAEKLQGSLLRTLLDAGLLFIIRFALDDTSDAVIAAAAQALCNLIVRPSDEVKCAIYFWVIRGVCSLRILNYLMFVPFLKARTIFYRTKMLQRPKTSH